MKKIFFLIIIFGLFSACSKDNRTEMEMIDDFITDNNLQGNFLESGLFISIENPGNGEKPSLEDKISLYYEGKYAQDGEVFDSYLDGDPISFNLNVLIPGWQEGLQYFGVGDEGWLVMPAYLAYGSFPPPGVRANAPMAFYIQLMGIE